MHAIIAFIGGLFLAAGMPVPETKHYVEVPLEDPITDLRVLVEAGFDIGGVDYERNVISLVVPQHKMQRVSSLRVLSQTPVRAPDSQYKRPSDVEKILKETEDFYPHLARTEVIGKSVEGRDVWAIELTARFVVPNQPKPKVLIDAMHHAREVMTTEVALDIVEQLTRNYETDPKVQEWLNKYSIWVVPMVNPDGNDRVWHTDSMWRKNTRGGHGVDVNRNYPYAWNACNGSSGSPSSDTYRGPSPGSEPETQALTSLASRLKPKFNISYHSYSEIVIYPFGCSPKKVTSPDADVYLTVGKELARRLVRDSGNGSYKPGTSYELLYDVDGGSVDWMYAKEKIMSFVIEINSTSQGFQPSYTKWREASVLKQRPGWQYILEQMAGPDLPSRPRILPY